jgi:hypothetical protein
MKENETSDRKELESINGEMFHSFDPEDASWIIGGVQTVCRTISGGEDKWDVWIDFV